MGQGAYEEATDEISASWDIRNPVKNRGSSISRMDLWRTVGILTRSGVNGDGSGSI